MAHTTVPTYASGQVVTATDFNTYLRDNDAFNFNGKALGTTLNSFSTWSTTSTSYVDIDSTNLSKTLTIATGRLAVAFVGTLAATNIITRYGTITLLLDGVDQGHATYGFSQVERNTTIRPFTIFWTTTGLSAGSHTVKLQWKVSNAALTFSLGENGTGAEGFIYTPVTFAAWEF